jgi:hypothetical protein
VFSRDKNKDGSSIEMIIRTRMENYYLKFLSLKNTILQDIPRFQEIKQKNFISTYLGMDHIAQKLSFNCHYKEKNILS